MKRIPFARSPFLMNGNGSWYYLQGSGVMAANQTLTINGKTYTFDASGKWIN